jgi:hypothetical protein
MFDKYTTVNGIRVKLNAYSESRFKSLRAINEEISEWINNNGNLTIADIPSDLKEKWWKTKADILWTSDVPYPEGFFASDDFESGLLKETEDAFLIKRLYI